MIPLLNAGPQGLRDNAEEAKRFGIIISSEAAKSAEQFNDDLTRINASMNALKISIAGGVTSSFGDWMAANVEAIKIAGSMNQALRLFAFNLDATTTEKPRQEIERLTKALNDYRQAGLSVLGMPLPANTVRQGLSRFLQSPDRRDFRRAHRASREAARVPPLHGAPGGSRGRCCARGATRRVSAHAWELARRRK